MNCVQTIIKKVIITLPATLILAIFLIMKSAPVDAAEAASPAIFCGGVSGLGDIAVAENSDQFRAHGGAIFLHSVGWENHVTESERVKIIELWKGHEYGIEMGYDAGNYSNRQKAYMRRYHNRGIRPAFVTVNAFSSARIPVVSQWEKTIQAYRDSGVTCPIYATFEYANFADYYTTLKDNLVSDRKDFQDVIHASGGMTIDIPPTVYWRRMNSSNPSVREYKLWILDAIRWAKDNAYTVGIIVSPNSSKTKYDEDTEKFVKVLEDENALPDIFVVENYSTEDPSTYVNRVGNEDTPHHQLGCARMLQIYFNPTPIITGLFPSKQTGSNIIKLCIYNLKGEKVKGLVYGSQLSGEYFRHGAARDIVGRYLSSGVYISIVTSEAGNKKVDKSVVLPW